MPKPRERGAASTSISFWSLMLDIRRKLEIEGRGRDEELPHVMRTQFAQVEKTLQPKSNPLSAFQWTLFEGVSNHFWPGSVRRKDQPSSFRSPRPYVNKCRFFKLDSNMMPFHRLVDFVQHNGDPPFRWAKKKKPKKQLKQERLSRRQMSESSENTSDPTILRRSSNPSPRPIAVAQPLRAVTAQTKSSPGPRLVWDEDIEIATASQDVTTFTKPNIPLSYACRPGWDLNKKENWVPAAGITPEPCRFLIEPLQIDKPVVQQSATSAVSFTRTPEEDVEAFLNNFLRREEDTSGDLEKNL